MENKGNWLLASLVVIFTVIQGLTGTTAHSKFGECCDEAKTCADGLTCGPQGTCECPENQIHDPESGKCLLLLGQHCESSSQCFGISTCNPEWNPSSGSFTHKCKCVEKFFYANPLTQTCEISAKYGESCNDTTRPCQDGSLMTCSAETNTCTCEDPGTQFFNPTQGRCGIRVGELCYYHRSQFDTCVQNAHCQYFFSAKKLALCQCNFGYLKGDVNGETCFASHMQVCNSTSICHEAGGLICTDGQCLCESPLTQVYDKNLHKCAGKIGTDCNNNSLSTCIENAICDPESNTCTCTAGYSETGDKSKCKLDYGAKCNSAGVETCNHDRGLVCKGNECVCLDPSLVYNTKLNVCTNQAERICGKLRQSRLRRKGKSEVERITNPIVVGCGEGLICAKIQGRDSCACMALGTFESDRTARIDLCL